MNLIKAVATRKKPQRGPHRYVDPKGRTWDWNPVTKKYDYVPVPGAPAAPTSSIDKDTRDRAIREDAANGMSLKDLAKKYNLSNARVYGIVRGKTAAATKKGAGRVRTSRERAYDAAPQDAKDCADVIGVLPLGVSATNYVKDNLQSIFKTTKMDASYLKGVNTFAPLGGLGAWLVDDDFTTQAEKDVKEIVKDLEDPNSGLKGDKGVHEDAKEWQQALTAINNDKKNLAPILEFIGEENPKGAKFHGLPSNMASVPMAYATPSIMLSHILPVDVLQHVLASGRSWHNVNRKFTEGNELSTLKSPTFLRTQDEDILKPLLTGMGISEKLWNRRAMNWDQNTFTALLLACMFPDEYGEVVKQWLEPTELPRDPSETYTTVIGGQGNDIGHQDPSKSWYHQDRSIDNEVRWTIEDFRKASEFIKSEYSKEWYFLHKYFGVDLKALKQYGDPGERYAGWRRAKHDSGQVDGDNEPFISTIKHSLRLTKDIVGADTFLKDLDAVPISKHFQGKDDEGGELTEKQIRSNVRTATKDLQDFCAKHSLPEPGIQELFSPTSVLTHFTSKLSHEVKQRVYFHVGSAFDVEVAQNYVRYGHSKAVPGTDTGPRYEQAPVMFKVEKSVSTGGYRGRSSYRENVSVNPVYGKDTALRGILRSAWDNMNHAHRASDINFTLGANYHARKMLKQRRSSIPITWPIPRISATTPVMTEDLFKKRITDTRESLVIKQITRRGKGVVQGSPDVVLSDVPKAEYDRIVKKVQDDHDRNQHGNFRIKVNGVYKITDSRMEPMYQEAAKKYGNEKKELYHGTSFKSGTPIIRGGYLIIKGKTASGRRVWRAMGDGIYLADRSSKSAQYIGGDFSHHTRGVLFLNDAAMGTVTENQYDNTAQTVFGAKGTRWKNNEWAIRDPKAVIPRYWIDVESV